MSPPRLSADTRKPYQGHTRSLVIAIDIGTTFSGVSYAFLEPAVIPKIHGVTRFPGQEHVAGNTKIPSIIYYDRHGKMMAAGAEADTVTIQAQAEDEAWIKAELFKLRLRPRTMRLNMNGMRLGPLPKRKTAVHVFGDFLAYLYRCTRNFITDTHANGAVLWNQVESDIQFVLSHPNGWEGAQQSKMRRAAIYGGLIPESNEGKARIRFVTEGEASLHACVLNGLAADVLSNPSKHGFLIADAGGGTFDISAYAIRATSPLVIEEIAPPDCIFAGSVFVSRRAREFLEGKLKNSRYGTPDALDHITRRFDETTKRLFRERKDLQFIPFGSPLDKDPSAGIRGGQLKLTGQEVADLFEPSVNAAFSAIKAQIEASQGMIKSVFLVGGYAASPWLFGQLQERLAPCEVVVSRPDTQTSKAVADGAIGFYCDHHVSARMSKFMYGVEFLREMDPRDPDHVARKERLCELPSGPKLLPDAFDCILSRGVRVKESTVFTRKYCTELTSLSMLSVFEVEIWCYRGGGDTIPLWINRQADNFSTLCVVRADLSPLESSAEPKVGTAGKTYWTIVFSVEIQFGLTEFKARIKWVDNGMTKYGPASIIYNERGHRADEDEPDVFPEDEANTVVTDNRPRSTAVNRSEPVSRTRTPVTESVNHGLKQPSIPPSAVSSRRPSTSHTRSEISHASGTGPVIPDVARLSDRDRSISRAHSVSSKNGYDSDRRTISSSSRSKDRDKDRRNERTEMPRATPRIGEALTAVWGADGGSQHVSPRHSAQPSPALGVTDPPPVGGSTTRGSSVYGGSGSDKAKSPSQHSLRSSHHTSHHSRSPYVETISTTIANPQGHSPWDAEPSSGNPRSRTISNVSGHSHVHTPHTHASSNHTPQSHTSILNHARSEKERIPGLWDDVPPSAYGEPPQTPWEKTPAQVSRSLGDEDNITVLLSTTTPGEAGHHMELPPPETLSRSVSLSGNSVHGDGSDGSDDIPLDAVSGWGGVKTPRSTHATLATVGEITGDDLDALRQQQQQQSQWSDDIQTPVPPATVVTPALSTTSSKGSKKTTSKRSRKNSTATSVLSDVKAASPVKSVINVGSGGEDEGGGESVVGSPNLLADAPGIGGHLSPDQQTWSPSNSTAVIGIQGPPVDAHGGGDGDLNWKLTGEGGGSNWGTSVDNKVDSDPSHLSNQPSSANNEILTREITLSPAPLAVVTTSLSPPPQSPAPVPTPPAPIDTQSEAIEDTTQTHRSPGIKTPKSIGSKTPKTPASEITKTPVIGGEPGSAEVSTPTTPTAMTTKKGKKKKDKGKAAAAAAAAEEEERRKKEEEEADRERVRLEQEEQMRVAKEAEEEEAKRQKIAAAEMERLAKEEQDRLEKEEQDRLANEEKLAREERERLEKEQDRLLKEEEAKEIAKLEAAAAAKAQKEVEEAEAKAKEERERKEKEEMEHEMREAEGRAAKEKAEQEAKEKAEQEAKEKAEQEAKEKAEQEQREKAEQEAKEREAAEQKAAEEAKAKAEEEERERTEREAQERAQQEAKEKAEREAQEQAEEERKAEEARKAEEMRKAEEERLAREQEARAKEEAERENEERARKENEEMEREKGQDKTPTAAGEESGRNSIFNFGGTGWGSSGGPSGSWGLGSWGEKAKSKAPSIKSAFGSAWGSSTFGSLGFGDAGRDSQLSPEEPKLIDSGEPAKNSSSLFDDWDHVAATPSNLANDPLDTPATEHAGDANTTHDPPPVLNDRAPSEDQHRVPSPSLATVPTESTKIPTAENTETSTETPLNADADPHGDPIAAKESTAPGTPTVEGTITPDTPAARDTTGPDAEEPPTATAEDDWNIPVKVKKGKKKTGGNSGVATPNPDGNEASGAGKKKKKRK